MQEYFNAMVRAFKIQVWNSILAYKLLRKYFAILLINIITIKLAIILMIVRLNLHIKYSLLFGHQEQIKQWKNNWLNHFVIHYINPTKA